MKTAYARLIGLLVATAVLMGPGVAQDATFEGLWETSYGRMRLHVDEGRVRGAYASVPGAWLEGEVSQGGLQFTYHEPNAEGAGRFELAADGRSFQGRWRAEGADAWIPWKGTRVDAKPGRRWLVILEARWESGLHEAEYTFGGMLRSYFTMAPEVQVRERRFHDVADFRRFAREVAFIAEPVILLVSTHGSARGISVGGQTIRPEVIAESLRDVGNVELLHLAGCDMLAGGAAEAIRAGIPASRRFPISGYKTTVDWAASALSDLTYLTFVLIRELSPEKALRQTRIAAPFTGDDPVERCTFQPLGLELLTADGKRVR